MRYTTVLIKMTKKMSKMPPGSKSFKMLSKF